MVNPIHPENRQGLTCDVCEAMCLDAVDGTLTAAEQASLDLHVATCAACAEQFAEAQRGAAWMEMLKAHRPEPSSSLLDSILAKTSGAAAGSRPDLQPVLQTAPALLPMPFLPLPSIVAAPVVAAGGGKLLQFRQRFAPPRAYSGGEIYLQPRLAMTAAMAFFSLALTMNLTGTKLGDLRPSALHRTVADAGAGAVRSFQSLRVVYQVEAKVSELRQDDMRDQRDGTVSRRTSERPESNDAAPVEKPMDRNADKPASKPIAPNGSSKLDRPGRPEFHLAGDRVESKRNATETQPIERQKGA